jgi:hypothetical protein
MTKTTTQALPITILLDHKGTYVAVDDSDDLEERAEQASLQPGYRIIKLQVNAHRPAPHVDIDDIAPIVVTVPDKPQPALDTPTVSRVTAT